MSDIPPGETKIPTSVSLQYRDINFFKRNQYSPSRLMQMLMKMTRNKELDCSIKDLWNKSTDDRFRLNQL